MNVTAKELAVVAERHSDIPQEELFSKRGDSKAGHCMDAVVAMDLDQPEAAARLHKKCPSARCGCECHL